MLYLPHALWLLGLTSILEYLDGQPGYLISHFLHK